MLEVKKIGSNNLLVELQPLSDWIAIVLKSTNDYWSL